jgi:hypothetical protein
VVGSLFFFSKESDKPKPEQPQQPSVKLSSVAPTITVDAQADKAEDIGVVEIEQTLNIEVVDNVIEDDALANIPWYERDDIRHYVVVGSYKSRRNAESAMKSIAESLNGEIECYIFKRGKMHTLAIYGSSDIALCEAFVASHKSEFAQAWVYSKDE